MMKYSAAAKTAIAKRKIVLSLGLMKKHMHMLRISIMGDRTATLRDIWYAVCMLVTSVVILVTRPAVLNLSMLEKEKVWIFSYIASLKFAAKPDDASAPKRPACTPKYRLKNASTSMIAP